MADYCTLAEAQNLIPGISIGASTVPTATQAGTYPTTITGELNALLRSRGNALPIVDATLLADLKVTACYGVAALVLQAKFGKDGAAAAPYLQLYRDGKQAIPGQHFGQGFTEDGDGVARTPSVTKGTVF